TVVHRAHVDLEPHAATVGPSDAEPLTDHRLSVTPGAAGGELAWLYGAPVLGDRVELERGRAHDLVERHRQELVTGTTEDVGGAAVAVDHTPVGTPDDEALAQGVEHR